MYLGGELKSINGMEGAKNNTIKNHSRSSLNVAAVMSVTVMTAGTGKSLVNKAAKTWLPATRGNL